MIKSNEPDAIIRAVRPYTVFSTQGLRALWDYARRSAHLEGDVAELGVYRGGSTILIAHACPSKMVHAFDTFSGIPNISDEDAIRTAPRERGHANGDFTVENVAEVRSRLESCGIRVYIGLFSETCRLVADRRFCFSHCDADTFLSTMEFLEFFYPRTVPGGYLMFDDYLWPATPGVSKAITSFLKNKTEDPLQVGAYQCVVVKSGG
jgi:O-methyltransferase